MRLVEGKHLQVIGTNRGPLTLGIGLLVGVVLVSAVSLAIRDRAARREQPSLGRV
jgi:hypothetical protein